MESKLIFGVLVFVLALTFSSGEECSSFPHRKKCCLETGCGYLMCGADEKCMNLTLPAEDCDVGTDTCGLSDATFAQGNTSASPNATTVLPDTTFAQGNTSASPNATTDNSSTATTTASGPIDPSTTLTTVPSSSASSPATNSSVSSTTETSTADSNQTATSPETPTTTAGAPCAEALGGFDAPSFIGGIVLCGGILGIVFFACKFYKARTENRYQQM